MRIQITDFNTADQLFATKLSRQWKEVEDVLSGIPLHLKESDQAGIQGNLIFDPEGANAAIKQGMESYRWLANVSMPQEFAFLGTDVDFVRSGVLVEVQFSNYPFLLNNTVRAELLFKSRIDMVGASIDALVMVTKAHMFPASNSTLYYERALRQLSELASNNVFDVPIRLVGLFSPAGVVDATFTGYHNPRHSRTVVDRAVRRVRILPGLRSGSRSRITFA